MADGKGRHIFGTVKAGERGKIVISKKAREIFHIKSGDMLLVLGDEEQGIAIVKDELFKKFAKAIRKRKTFRRES
jgi:AbrB family looped-hinge helix DNA binding protein